jgi:hypothetical protein
MRNTLRRIVLSDLWKKRTRGTLRSRGFDHSHDVRS